jgi:hypothetical protein
MSIHVLCGVALACLAVSPALGRNAKPLAPGPGPIPEGLGANIHFTDPQPGEMKMLAEGGFHWLRMDFAWERIERKKGEYDWSPYDRLVKAAEPHGMRFLFILDYSNRLYETDRSVRTEAGRAAMARWAAAAVKRYQGKGILWEMWNEPNIAVFWKPRPDAKDYVLLAKAVGEAIRQAAPGEVYIGPATSTVDFRFLEACFQGGLLEDWSAVSVHPYRQQPPETVEADYARLRRLIEKYAPKGKHVPILSGEWGYSSAWRSFDADKQGKYLPRQWLINLANDIPVSIWYDWHDDGRDPKEPEHHFGTVLNPANKGRDPLYDAKPAYLAARTLTTVLNGFRFNKRLAVGSEDAYVLLFAKGDEVRIAAWTTAPKGRTVTIPASPGRFSATGHTGEKLPVRTAGEGGLEIALTDAPVYLVPEKPNDLLRVAAAWQRVPLDVLQRGGARSTYAHRLRNPLDRAIRLGGLEVEPGREVSLSSSLHVPRRAEPLRSPLELDVAGIGRIRQMLHVVVTNPLDVVVRPAAGKVLPLVIRNPSGEPLRGRIELTDAKGIEPVGEPAAAVRLAEGQTKERIDVALAHEPGGPYAFGLRIVNEGGEAELELPPLRFAPVDDFARYGPATLAKAYRLVADGDAKVASTQSLALGEPQGGPPLPGVKSLRITYDMKEGWKFIRLAPQDEATRRIDGRPRQLVLWLHGDGSGHSPRLRFTDATGQTFQPTADAIEWKGWRSVTFPMDGGQAGHWGGADDGAVHYPIRWDTLLLIDKARDQAGRGEIHFASPTLVQ